MRFTLPERRRGAVGHARETYEVPEPIPVSAGSVGYAVGETLGWRASLEKKATQAPKFYPVIAAATMIGLGVNFVGLNPIRALYWSAILNGIVATPLMVMPMLMSPSKAVVGKFALPTYLRIIGWAATAVMFIASAGFLMMSLLGKS